MHFIHGLLNIEVKYILTRVRDGQAGKYNFQAFNLRLVLEFKDMTARVLTFDW